MRCVSHGILSLIVLLGALTSCLESETTHCDNGTVCARGSVCSEAFGCLLPEQLVACLDRAEGDACDFSGVSSGRCTEGACISAGCGNSVVDEMDGEVCDDGNNSSGDGCRGDCRKVEECGDAIVDEGESCDDGNQNPADSCDLCSAVQWTSEASAGNTSDGAGLLVPTSIALDLFGGMYIVSENRVSRLDLDTGIIAPVAGNGNEGFSGDGGPATSALLYRPEGIAVDGLSNIYISDSGNNRIRRVDGSTGIITTVAGTGDWDFYGDGGLATGAALYDPGGIAVDGLGNLYIADRTNNRIRRVDGATGIITTLTGDGSYGSGGDGGLAVNAQLNYPFDVAVDGQGNVYIADTDNNRIRRVDMETGIISTIAGTGSYGFSGDGGPAVDADIHTPGILTVDSQGNIYIVTIYSDYRVRRVDFATGNISTVAGNGEYGFSGDGGPAVDAVLYAPRGVAVDELRNLYIADTANRKIRRVDSATAIIDTISGTNLGGFPGDGGAAIASTLNRPQSVATDAVGNVYFADNALNNSYPRIARIDRATGVISTVAGNGDRGFAGDGGPATSAQIQSGQGIAVDGSDNIYFSDNGRIRRVDGATGIITTFAGNGSAGFSGDGGVATEAMLSSPSDVAVDSLGNVYIADAGNDRIRRVDVATGIITTFAGDGSTGFSGDGGPATDAVLDSPGGIALDGQGNVYIADTVNNRIRRVDAATGDIDTIAGTGVRSSTGDDGPATSATLDRPREIAADPFGNVFIPDYSNHRIRHVHATMDLIVSLSGTGSRGFSGDGGPATSAQLNNPEGLAIDGDGNLIAAVGAHIRRIEAGGGAITTVAGAVAPEGIGPLPSGRFADPRSIVVHPEMSLVAGGTTGTLQIVRNTLVGIETAAGRYPHPASIGELSRFRAESFGEVGGVAYNSSEGIVYMTESTANRIHAVTMVDPANVDTWTIAILAGTGDPGFADGAAVDALFRKPTGLYLEAGILYVADTGNHVIRAIDLSTGSVTTVAGRPQELGRFGDGGSATNALLHEPHAITRCNGGELFIADTRNNQIRRVDANGTITTVLGDGIAASSGQGAPAYTFPVDSPFGLACDSIGNLMVSSRTTVRMVAADDSGIVDGTGAVYTLFGALPRDTFPASAASCLTGIYITADDTVHVTDSCTGMLIELRRELAP